MKTIQTIIFAVVFLITSSAVVYAKQCPLTSKASTSEEGEVVNSVCPAMGTTIEKDTPYTIEYEGETIGFCCAKCMEEFKVNPKAYLDKLKDTEETNNIEEE